MSNNGYAMNGGNLEMTALIHGFELLRDERIPEMNSRARLYRHVRTGAELLSLENDDENKVFGITFRTLPMDDTGLPHIMEHSVLCGSRKYPVKEPFVELMKGSLNTFLNAMTYPDKTCYPVASQNLQDFYNLVDVYLDAVFNPLLSPYTLKQEGWHYALENPEGEMIYKGVVFNEMKGSYSSPDSLIYDHVIRQLFPDTPYGRDSGGDPEKIPDLTYEQFLYYHRTFYHPSNARIFFYGNDDPENRLRMLDAYLQNFEFKQVPSVIPLQERTNEPRRVRLPYEVSAEDEAPRHFIALSWMLPEVPDAQEALTLSLLEHVLIGTPASPLRKALIESGLGEDLTAANLTLDLRQPVFSVGLKGVPSENLERVEGLILETLQQLAEQGVDAETLWASLNTLEFRLREQNTGSYPRGLFVMLQALALWLYDKDPIEALRFEAPLSDLRQRLTRGERLLEERIRRLLLENPHRVTVILDPDPTLAERRASAERARLEKARAGMTEEQLRQVVEETLELKRRQETPDSPEALATIPTLKLSDLEREIRRIPSEEHTLADIPTLYHDLFTNGIVYLDLAFNLRVIPQEWLGLLPLFGRALTEMGTSQQSYVQLIQRIGQKTGGIWAQLFLSAAPERQNAEAWLVLRAKAMLAQTRDLLTLLHEILTGVRLDDAERFRQMVLEEKASLETRLIYSGHRMAATRLRAGLDEAGWLSEQTGGISYLFFLRQLAREVEQNWTEVHARLEGIRDRLLQRQGLRANVTVHREGWQTLQPALSDFLASLPQRAVLPSQWKMEVPPPQEGLIIPAQVNYVGKGGNLFEAGYSLHGSIYAITQYLNATYFWEKVRVQGGAYGGFCSFDPHSGAFLMLSYRDPNLLRTLDVYDQTAQFLRNLQIEESERVKAIIGAIGELDAYQLPDAKGYTAFQRALLGITDERRQRLRDQLLNTRVEDFHHLADALEALAHQGRIAVLGAEPALQEAAQQHGFSLQRIL